MLPDTATGNFRLLATEYADHPIEFPHLKAVTLAQWAKESGWGTSRLAAQYLNYAGAKWREYMRDYATPIMYAAHDGKTRYCEFRSHAHFIDGYWARLDIEPAYEGWRDHTETPESFIAFVGPIWVTGEREPSAAGDRYVEDVLRICAARTDDLFSPPED